MLGCFFFLQPFITSIFFTSPSPIVWKSDKMAAIFGMTQLPLDWKKKKFLLWGWLYEQERLSSSCIWFATLSSTMQMYFRHSPPPPRGIFHTLDALRLKIQLIGVKQYQNQI